MNITQHILNFEVSKSMPASSQLFKQAIGGLLKSLRQREIDIPNETLFYESGNHYPLIQYFSDKIQVGISGYNDGADALFHLFPHIKTLRFGNQIIHPDAIWMGKTWHVIDFSPEPLSYRLHQYLGLNSTNYADVKNEKDPYVQKAILMKALTGHLRGAVEGLSFALEDYPRVQILRWGRSRIEQYKQTPLTCLETLDFTCDLILPSGIGIGKGSALGYGRLERLVP